MNALEHVVYQLRNAKINEYPFPHFYIEEVFPWDFYAKLRENLPKDENYSEEVGKYKGRRFADPVDDLLQPFKSSYFAQQVLFTFKEGFMKRFPDGGAKFSTDWRLVRDAEGYSIGPHTDAPWKVVSLLFYLPYSDVDFDCGTSIFVPDDHETTNIGGPHFKEDGFSKAFTAPYIPNSVFGFWKTDNSWHGVSEIQRKIQRDVLLFNIYDAGIRK